MDLRKSSALVKSIYIIFSLYKLLSGTSEYFPIINLEPGACMLMHPSKCSVLKE
jgi:hypothetical protein